jgi:TIR domain
MGSPAMNEPTVTASRAYSPEVMVSYSSHDRVQVMQFVQRLRAAGVAAWIDQGGIDGAQRWGEEIVNAIDSCKTVLLMISQTSMQSENIAKEVMLAWENNKHFLPLCLEDAKIAKSMQYQLAGIQQIKLYEGDPEAKFVSVLRALVRLGIHVSPYYIALVSADLGEREQAFEWLERACKQRSSSLARLKTEPRFSVLHGDPRFAALMKRVELLPLEEEGAIPDVPVFSPRPMIVPQTAAPAKPAPLWRKILWPDIYDGRSARQAAAQGVWMSGLLIFLTILAVLFPPAPGSASVFGAGIATPTALVIILMLGAIGFGVQKMGRPAAIIGLVVCASGALQNLTKVQQASATLDAYSAQYRQYEVYAQQYPQYSQVQNPMVQAYQQASSLYYGSWFALLISLISVGAFTNATRGTLGYRRMVMARTTPDKQDAVTGDDLAAIKSTITSRFAKSRTAVAPARIAVAPAPVASPPIAPQATRPQPGPIPVPPIATVATAPPVVPAPLPVVTPSPTEAVLVAPVIAAEPVRQSFAAMIGVSGGLIYWPRVLAFLLANLAASLVFMLSRSVTAPVSVPAGYWLWAICAACIFSAATVAGFRFVPNAWAAMAVAAGLATLVTLPFCALLPSFAWADIGYREQFQQFILLPLIASFILLAALSWVVPRLQPMVLALWLAAMGAEIAASVVLNLLHLLGAGEPPDVVLGGASVISAVLRSLAFALMLWGGLEYLRKQAAKATAA